MDQIKIKNNLYIRTSGALVILLLWSIMFAFFPVKVYAAGELDDLEFQSISDYQLLIGEAATIKINLFDDDHKPFSGSVSATITGSDGIVHSYSISGSGGNYSVNNVTLDYEGEYELVVTDNNANYATGTLEIVTPVIEIDNDIAKNIKSLVTGVLKDPEGNNLARKTITVDGNEIGLTSNQTVTTAFDGSFSFWITPTKMGKLKFLFQGHEIGEISVQPAYVQQKRIGENAKDNIELSIEIAREGWSSADKVILTRDDILADALTAVPLSKKLNAPIFMNPRDKLDSRVWQEIGYLGTNYIMIIGGEGAISRNIEQELINSGYTVGRIAGGDRYETAARITSMFDESKKVFLAYGHGEPDALAASSFAAIEGIPILLTAKDQIPEVTRKELARLNPTEVILLGGNGVIDPQVETDLKKNYLVNRWGGADRYDTQWAILRNMFTDQSKLLFSSAMVSLQDVSSGKPYGDALLTAALAAKNNAAALFVPSNYLPKSLEYFLVYNRGYITGAKVVGNTTAISPLLEKQIEQLLTR